MVRSCCKQIVVAANKSLFIVVMITLVKTILLDLERLYFWKKTFQILLVKSQKKYERRVTNFKQSVFCK